MRNRGHVVKLVTIRRMTVAPATAWARAGGGHLRQFRAQVHQEADGCQPDALRNRRREPHRPAETQQRLKQTKTRSRSDSAGRLFDISLTLCKIVTMQTRTDGRIPTLPPKEALILELLVREKELYGLELVAASKGRLKRGTVYVTLGRMEEKGYITSRQEDAPPSAGGLPRRIYEPTAFGRRVLRTWTQMAARLMPEFAR